jgi:hypothetical protein
VIRLGRERPVESRADLEWLDPPRRLSKHCRITVVAFDQSKPLPSWLADDLAEQAS